MHRSVVEEVWRDRVRAVDVRFHTRAGHVTCVCALYARVDAAARAGRAAVGTCARGEDFARLADALVLRFRLAPEEIVLELELW